MVAYRKKVSCNFHVSVFSPGREKVKSSYSFQRTDKYSLKIKQMQWGKDKNMNKLQLLWNFAICAHTWIITTIIEKSAVQTQIPSPHILKCLASCCLKTMLNRVHLDTFFFCILLMWLLHLITKFEKKRFQRKYF